MLLAFLVVGVFFLVRCNFSYSRTLLCCVLNNVLIQQFIFVTIVTLNYHIWHVRALQKNMYIFRWVLKIPNWILLWQEIRVNVLNFSAQIVWAVFFSFAAKLPRNCSIHEKFWPTRCVCFAWHWKKTKQINNNKDKICMPNTVCQLI